MSFTIHRFVCATPPGLEDERDLLLKTLAEFAERILVPRMALFAPATFPNSFDAKIFQAAVKSNIKDSVFYLGIYDQDPPDPIFKRFVELAIECQSDPAMPMRNVTLLFKDAGDVADEMLKLRERMNPLCDVQTFSTTKDLPAVFEAILAKWFALLPAAT